MKHIRTFESYRSLRNKENEQLEPVNEEIFGAIGKFFSNLFKNIKQKINKVKGGQEVEEIYNKYLTKIQQEIKKAAGVELNLSAATKTEADAKAKADAEKKTKPEAKKENQNHISNKYKKIFEAEADTKLEADKLKQKKEIIQQIVDKMKTMALKEMDAVLKKFGGAAENPQLEIVITAKKDEFELAFLNAQVDFLEKAGDKTQVAEVVKKRDAVSQKVQKQYKELDAAKAVKYEEDDEIIYLKKDKTKEDWGKLSDDEKKKPQEGKAKELVSVGTYVSKEGDKVKIKDADGETAEIASDRMVGKVESNKEMKFKEGDEVTWTSKDGKEITKKIERAEKGKYYFTKDDGEEFFKKEADLKAVEKKEEGEKAEGQAQGQKKEEEGGGVQTQGQKKEEGK
jgi:hypothetical protein